MINTTKTKPSGLNRQALRTWGMFFLLAGVGSGIIRNYVLGLGNLSVEELLEAMQDSSTMALSTMALVLQAVETCAVPIFAFLLVEGFQKTSNFRNYILRVLGAAVLCEVPYNIAMCGKVLAAESRNPIFAVVLCLVALFFFRQYGEKTFNHRVIRAVVVIAALLWAWILKIAHAPCFVALVCVLWLLRNKPRMQLFAGCLTVVFFSVGSAIDPEYLFYLAAPLAFLAIHFYNGEKGEGNRWVNYLAYPAVLLAAGAAAILFM